MAVKGVEDDERVSKFITRNYGEDKQAQRKRHEEADQEQFDKDSLFTPSQDQTSTSEAGTTSSLDEDSPRLKQRISSFKYTKFLAPHSHHLPSPSSKSRNSLHIPGELDDMVSKVHEAYFELKHAC